MIFQTWDDLIGIFGDPEKSGKSNDGDIIQGKKTIPLYLSYTHAPTADKLRLDQTIWSKTLNTQDIKRVKSLIHNYGLQPTQEFMQTYVTKCRTHLENLPYSTPWKELFEDLLSYLLARQV